MPQLSETISDSPDTILLYGVSGSGKTTLIGRMAQHERYSPIYMADWDLRLTALRASLDPSIFKNIYYDEFRDKTIGGEAYTSLENISRNLPKLDEKYKVHFKTIIIDSGTFAMDGIMARVLTLAGKSPKDAPTLPNYMDQQSALRDLIQRFTSCGRHFVFTCHENTDKDEVTGRMFKTLSLTGKSAEKTPGYFNELWHCEVSPPKPNETEPTYKVRTRSDALYSARTSYKCLDSVELQTNIWQKIINSKKV